MDESTGTLEAGRAAYADRRWGEARACLLEARARGPLSAEDMTMLGDALWWEGAIDEALAATEEAYRTYLHGDDPAPGPAALLAIDIGFSWFLRGEEALASGWISRAQRLLAHQPASIEHAYLDTMAVEEAIGVGEVDRAIELARAIAVVARAHRDETLEALALVSEGIAAIKAGRVSAGLAVLDEAMLPVVAGRVRPAFAGNIYCQLMSVCHELADLRRAEQWTDATARWCEGFDKAVMFVGVCRMHRAQLLQVRGAWDEAEAEIAQVCEELAAMNVAAVGLALYERGEVRRQRGDLVGAEEAYGAAHRHGRDPLPGLALLRVAQGRAAEGLQALLAAETATGGDRLAKARLWEGIVAAAAAVGDGAVAARAAQQLDEAASIYASSGLVASAARARGIVHLLEGRSDEAMTALRGALRCWQELDAPYRAAEVRLELARALDAQGNATAAALEREAAEAELGRLGVELAAKGRGNASSVAGPGPGAGAAPGGLTRREAEIVGLVARGMSNRAVAEALVLSEKTVARHLANVYAKLGVGSRTAAAAWAHEQGLVPPGLHRSM